MMRRFGEDVSGSRLAFIALLLTSWASGAVVAQDIWKTSSGKSVAGVPVGVGYDQASREQAFIFEVDGKKTVRVPKSAFSDSAAEEIEAAIKVNGKKRAVERDVKKKKQEEEAAKKSQEDMKRQQEEQRRKEEEWNSQKFVDSKGREWTREEINKYNDAIWLEIDRAKMKHADRGLGESEPLGAMLEKGNGVLGGLQQFANEGFPCARQGSGVVYQSIGQFMDHVGRANGKNVELLFEYTDAERFLLMFPDGRLRTAEQMWNEALLGNWPAIRAQPAANVTPAR
jgi:hypothetical protein